MPVDEANKPIAFADEGPDALDALARTLRPQRDPWDLPLPDRLEDAWQPLEEDPCLAAVTDLKIPSMGGLDLNDCRDAAVRVQGVLSLRSKLDRVNAHNRLLAEEVGRQSMEAKKARLRLICRLGRVAEHRDQETGNHVVRVGCLSRAIGEALGLPRDYLERLALAAPLHDIGKIGIPDRILLKPGPLSPGEWTVMQRHAAYGEMILREQTRALAPLLNWSVDADCLDGPDPMLDMAASIALTHHEQWDGGGYPLGLSGQQIPLESRIVALADVFDALLSRRPYKPACPEAKALDIMRRRVESHFDPEIYAAFSRALDEIRAIQRQLADDNEDAWQELPR